MKRIKKNLFTVGLISSMMLGFTLSFSVEKAEAYQILLDDQILEGTYFDSGISHYFMYEYVKCSNCATLIGKPVGIKKSYLI